MRSYLSPLLLASALTAGTQAHTVFSRMYIDDVSQGDGTCVRMPNDASTAVNPLRDVTSTDMACGVDGLVAVPYTCGVTAGTKLTFEFRSTPDGSKPGSVDKSHKGPCAVYLKQVSDMNEAPNGGGWMKIWSEGYDEKAGQWCTEKFMANNGLLSINLPTALPTGYYLVRPELLALHQAYEGDPQFFLGCAQLYVSGTGTGTLTIPADREAKIPGYVSKSEKALSFDIWAEPMALPYPVPGPDVYFPTSSKTPTPIGDADYEGKIPDNCILTDGGWCGVEVPSYSDSEACWKSVDKCYAEGDVCWKQSDKLPAGGRNCDTWNGKCKAMESTCKASKVQGPPAYEMKQKEAPIPGPIPAAVNAGAGSSGDSTKAVSQSSGEGADSSTAAGASKTAVAMSAPLASTKAASKSSATGAADDSGSNLVSSPTSSVGAKQTTGSSGKVSQDGKCGGKSGLTCAGSSFGDCCSQSGKCGSSKVHCGCGCQSAFGRCK